jgi:acetyltransferase EpsM
MGGPGDGLVVAEAVKQAEMAGQPVKLAGFLNDILSIGELLYGVPVLAKIDDWRDVDGDIVFAPALQKVRDMPARVRRMDKLGVPDERWFTVIHPRAAVSSDTQIGFGAFVASCATVQPESRIGRFATLRAGAMLGHHCQVDDHTYVGPNAVMCGRSRLEFAAHLGPGSVLMDSRTMGRYSISGIGAVIVKNVPDRWVMFGNPAKRVGYVKVDL